MNVSAETKCNFAKLKYEQLLSDKYFVETCFSKKYSSYSAKQHLADMLLEIQSDSDRDFSHLTTVEIPDCPTVEDSFSSEFSNEFE